MNKIMPEPGINKIINPQKLSKLSVTFKGIYKDLAHCPLMLLKSLLLVKWVPLCTSLRETTTLKETAELNRTSRISSEDLPRNSLIRLRPIIIEDLLRNSARQHREPFLQLKALYLFLVLKTIESIAMMLDKKKSQIKSLVLFSEESCWFLEN